MKTSNAEIIDWISESDTAERKQLVDAAIDDALKAHLTRLEEQTDEVRTILNGRNGDDSKGGSVTVDPEQLEEVTPVTLLTFGASTRHKEHKEPRRRLTLFKNSVEPLIGERLSHQTLGRVVGLLLSARSDSAPIVHVEGKGVSFVSRDPQEYIKYVEGVRHVGPVIARSVFSIAENATKSPRITT